MKNVYELSLEDKSKFRGEFNKLRFTKDVNLIRVPSLFIAFFTYIGSGIMAGLVEDGVVIKPYADLMENIWVISLLLFIIFNIYLNISFKRWMKIKHNIEY